MSRLIKMAEKARESAYAPYSGFKVGAALLTSDGKIFTGCNIENSSYGATICAERVAIFKAVSEGYRGFSKLAVTAMPCGMCRQALAEFCGEDFEVIVGKEIYRLGDILPNSFTLPKEE